jgi:hypothetical protein
LAFVLACTQPVDTEKTATDDAKLQLWCPIDVVNEVSIAATPEKIWSIMVDLDSYAQWNPWLIKAKDTTSAAVTVGDNVDATVVLGTGPSSAAETITVVTPPGTAGQPAGQLAQFCWRDAIPVTSSLVPAYRCRTLHANADGTVHLVNDLTLQGVIDWVAWVFEKATLDKGMGAEDNALKDRAER